MAPKPNGDRPPSLVFGPDQPPLWSKTLGSVIEEQAQEHGDKTALVVPWQSVRLSYRDLADRSKILAKAMLNMGLRHGDCIGIVAGNCYQYIEVFLGGARIGCPVVVLSTAYMPEELKSAVVRSCMSFSLSRMCNFFFFLSVGTDS